MGEPFTSGVSPSGPVGAAVTCSHRLGYGTHMKPSRPFESRPGVAADRIAPEVAAAGAVVWRVGPDGDIEVALIHRPRYDDWSFPKGKLFPSETPAEAAVREVGEETGFRCRMGKVIGSHRYRDSRARWKEVTYWLMEWVEGRFDPSDEVDRLRWVPLAEAERVLTYHRDRELLRNLRIGR
jgi:8-oxo-dGTP pyrophosphatase MutT (NUDIX family)